MKKKVVFLSLPMSGREEDEIFVDIAMAKTVYLDMTGMDIQDVAFVHNYFLSENALRNLRKDAVDRGYAFIEPYHLNVWRMGNALENIAYCDEVFFYGDWENSRGCMLEYSVCINYDIPKLEWNNPAYKEKNKKEEHDGKETENEN